MNLKWFFGLVIVAVAFLGISLEQTAVPNQEIIVQFNIDGVSANDTESTVAIVTKQLQSIGVEGIRVAKTVEGNLKITYYSTIDVAVVKDLFARQAQLQLGYIAFNSNGDTSSQPFDSGTATYELNVSEIQIATDAALGLNGVLVEVKSGNEWYVNPLLYVGNATAVFDTYKIFEKVAQTHASDVALGIDTSSYKIPEVRAGPLS
jgi:hypothetical protein